MQNKKRQYDAMIEMMIGSSNLSISKEDVRKLSKDITEFVSDIIAEERLRPSGEPIINKMQNIFTIPLILRPFDLCEGLSNDMEASAFTEVPLGVN